MVGGQNIENIAVLGSTGSIGRSTLAVIRKNPKRFRVIALVAKSNVSEMFRQCAEFKPRFVCLSSAEAAKELSKKISKIIPECEVLSGMKAIDTIVSSHNVDSVMAGINGSSGLMSTLADAKAG